MPSGPDAAVKTERRGNSAPIPPNIKSILNQQQSLTLHNIENFGWQLAFVRQEIFQAPVTVVISPDRHRFAVLETDGRVDMQPGIMLRE